MVGALDFAKGDEPRAGGAIAIGFGYRHPRCLIAVVLSIQHAAIAQAMQPFLYAIGIGSNRRHGRHGAPSAVLRAAIAALTGEDVRLVDVSPIIATPALGPAGRGFANAALIVETQLHPPALLARLKTLERAFGRRRGRRWGARVLDLDILLWSGGRWPEAGGRGVGSRGLVVPHRSLEERDFVLAPLSRIAAHWPTGSGGRRVRHARYRLIGRLG